ncbi:hypothetical protein CH373_17080 [Leptospira perolatii]|uniref:ComF family protein n=1 Tax=Leptospira perolatii TaxID=2023191 RepID=A0A2M9ZIQ6_9LEPT|nr:ComF family protein [Leptospira perolatii]PJZ68167.1 hypothetical protein CH360_17650 [Leptospira perolatii]PJZ71945.1 hypothetical protein CH373_17080 [Leptospira perolatii]
MRPRIWKKLTRTLTGTIFPLCCGICGKEDFFARTIGICRPCSEKPISNQEKDLLRCRVCSSPLNVKECRICSTRNIFFSEARFLRNRDELHAEILNRIKKEYSYGPSIYLSTGARRQFLKWMPENLDACICLPSAPAKWWGNSSTRPFHVCTELYERAKEILQIPKLDVLEKLNRERQAGKSYSERFFYARKSWKIKTNWIGKIPKNILLLDDIFTTGASINEVSRLLRDNGAEKILVLTYLRTLE